MKKKYRLLSLALVLVICLSFCGCHKNTSLDEQGTDTPVTGQKPAQNSEATPEIKDENKALTFENISIPDRASLKTPYSMFYKRDGKLCCYDTQSGKETVLTDNVGDVDASEDRFHPITSVDGSVVAYTEKNDRNQKSAVLCIADLKSGKRVTVCENATSSHLGDDGRYLYYVTEDGSIFVYDNQTGKKEQVAENAQNFIFSRHGKTAFFVKDGSLYVKNVGKTALKADDDVAGFVEYAQNANVLYYRKSDGTVRGADSLASVNTVGTFSESYYPHIKHTGEVYYNVGETLYYFDGEKSSVLSERYALSGSDSYNKHYTFFEFKEGVSIDTSSDEFRGNENKFANYYYVIDGKKLTLPSGNIKAMRFLDGYKTLYYISDYDETETIPGYASGEFATGNMYVVDFTDEKAGTPKLYDKNVLSISSDITSENVIYFKNESDVTGRLKGTLYCNKKKIADNVFSGFYSDKLQGWVTFTGEQSFRHDIGMVKDGQYTRIAEYALSNGCSVAKDGSIIFATDQKGELHNIPHTMNVYKDGTVTELLAGVTHQTYTSGGELFCITYDEKSSLYVYKDGELTKLFDDVLYICEPYSGFRARKLFIPDVMEISSHYLYP